MTPISARFALVFSCLGHSLMHLLAAFYFVIVLRLEQEWQLPYHELVELWTLGALLIGLGAIPAGWLGDRWSAPGMMIVMFVGMGLSTISGGLSTSPTGLLLSLSALGLFAAIYHPVAIAWLVRSAKAQGKALGLNGIFGSVGVAASGIVTGLLLDISGWRAAFIVPGVFSLVTGLVLWWLYWRGLVVDTKQDQNPQPSPSRQDMIRGFAILLITMLMMGLAFHVMQAALPKLFSLRLELSSGALGIGSLVAGVYTIAGIVQFIGGHLADKYSLKAVYLGGLLLQAPILALVAQTTGIPLVLVVTIAVFLNAGILPAENMLIARYTPAKHRSLAYGIKFVLAFSCAPLAVILVSYFYAQSGEFMRLYWLVAGSMAAAFAIALWLPKLHPNKPALASASV